jgi:phosphocarrier protein
VVSRTAAVVNPLGLHARAAARFVRTASAFRSHVRVTRGTRTTDGKSILGLLLLAAARGTTLTIAADGPDEADALEALCALAARGFEDA